MSGAFPEVEAYVAAVVRRIPRAVPGRAAIADDVRMHLMERVEAGEPVAEAIRRMGTPEEVARAYLDELHLPVAAVHQRAAAFLIDVLLGLLLAVPAAGLLFGGLFTGVEFRDLLGWPGAIALVVTLALSVMLLSVLYFPVLEAIFGQTLGKRLMGLCVTTEAGEQIGWVAAIVRRLPFFLEFFWIDALFALFTRRRQRAFDLVAKTLVVRAAPGTA